MSEKLEPEDLQDEEQDDVVSEEPMAFDSRRSIYKVKPGCTVIQGGQEITEGEPITLTASQFERLRDHVA